MSLAVAEAKWRRALRRAKQSCCFMYGRVDDLDRMPSQCGFFIRRDLVLTTYHSLPPRSKRGTAISGYVASGGNKIYIK